LNKFIDLSNRRYKSDIDLLFHEWNGDEQVVILSPHDDDALLGCGYLILDCLERGVMPHILIFCKGDAGYSYVSQKDSIVEIRKKETECAYKAIGLNPDHIHRLEMPDFSLVRQAGRTGALTKVESDEHSIFNNIVYILREVKCTRVVIPNYFMEHPDHEQVYKAGIYDAVQSSDLILAEYGSPAPLKSLLMYAVWADFSPYDAMLSNRSVDIRADMALVVHREYEERVIKALLCFSTQAEIINSLIEQRKGRVLGNECFELYRSVLHRPSLDYKKYTDYIKNILEKQENRT